MTDFAEKYHAAGFSIVGLNKREKTPIGAWKRYQSERATAAQIKNWLANGYNIGLVMGGISGGLVALDFDQPGAFEDWSKAFPHLINTAIAKTGKGYHVLFKMDLVPGNKNMFWRGRHIGETRGEGGYIAIAPSIHPNGQEYFWLSPPWDGVMTIKSLAETGIEFEAPNGNGNGNGHNPAYTNAAFENELSRLATATAGNRNTTLNTTAFNLGQFVAAGELAEIECVAALESTARAIGLGETEARKTIQSGMNAGKNKPRVLPEPRQQHQNPQPETPTDAPATGADDRRPTHDELAARWLAAAPLTAHGLGDWRRYEAGIWPVCPDAVIRREMLNVLTSAKNEGIRPTTATLASVMEFCRLNVWQDDRVWDADPDYLVCRNGALHIPTASLCPHKPELYATSEVSYEFDPDAEAPNWDRFLWDLSAETGFFLQEFAGYALTIGTQYEIAVWLYGPPGGGKSTFLAGLQAMLGDRAGLLGLADIERSRFALAGLPGKTLAIATEQPGSFITAAHLLNAIISGEPITVERKFKEALTITPRAKLCWAMNELPRVSDPNSGLFRRVKVVEFPAIAPDKRDPLLKENITREGAGILNWALIGLERLRARGRFDIPAAITDATTDFKTHNDIPANFVAECCTIGPDCRAGATELYNTYRVWCEQNGHKPQSSTSLATDWKRLGFERRRISGKSFYFGVGIVAG